MTGTSSTQPKSLPPCGRLLSKPETHQRLLQTLVEKLETYVAREKLNRSDTRVKMLEVIVSEIRHFKAQDLVDRLQKEFPHEVGRSTVYRNLPILVNSGVIQEGPRGPDGEILYELSEDEHHDHIVCLDCHHIFEFNDPSIEEQQLKVTRNLGFDLSDHRHVIYAKCSWLRAKKS